MVNDINNINAPQPGKPRNSGSDTVDNAQTGAGGSNSTSSTATANNSGDTVQLSSQALELSRIQRDLQSSPEVDEVRVSEIRERITNGTYTVDANRLAAKILADDQNFGI